MMILAYYTLHLLLFDQMLSSRVPKSASYRQRLGGNCVLKTLLIIGFLVIIGVIALNFVFLFLVVFGNHSQDTGKAFDIILISTLSVVTAWFTISLFVMYIR